MSDLLFKKIPMTKEAIKKAAAKLETTYDLLCLLNKIKMAELGEKGYPFIMPHLNYFINPARNKKSYKTFYIPKKSGGVREISAPKALLKSFLTYTNKLLQAFYDAPQYVTGFVPEKSVVDNAEFHIGKNFVFNTDLKDFFPSITKSRIWATLKHPPFNFNDTIADAIAGLCCTETVIDGKKHWVLPQGSPCSPVLTNIVCQNLDRQLQKLAKKYRLRYSRYADDITFSSNRNVFRKDGSFQIELKAIIVGQNFNINEKKTRLQPKNMRQEVTGLVVSDRVNVSREYVRNIDNLLYIWEKYGEADAYAKFLMHYTPKQNLHKDKPNMRAVLQGKLLYLKMVKGADNEVWKRLQQRFNKLTGNNAANETEAAKFKYVIADFEKKIGTPLRFEFNDRGILQCSFSLNEARTAVALSRYARTRITNILTKNNLDQIEKFKNGYMLIFYEGKNHSFWRIERKMTRVKIDPMSDGNPIIEKDPATAVANNNLISERPNLLTRADKMIESLQIGLGIAFDDKKHDHILTLFEGSKVKVRYSVSEVARNYEQVKKGCEDIIRNRYSVSEVARNYVQGNEKLFAKGEEVKRNVGMVMGKIFDAAIKGAFDFGAVPKMVNLDEKSRRTIQQYYDSLKESLDKAYGKGKWKAYTMNLSITGAYRYGEHRFTLAGTPDIIIDTENEWLVLVAKTTYYDKLNEVIMQQYSMQTSIYRRLLEDKFPVLVGKIKTGLIVAEANYPNTKKYYFDRRGNLHFGLLIKSMRWDNEDYMENGIYGFTIKADVNSDLFKSLLKATDYIDIKDLETISEEELKNYGLTAEDFISNEQDGEYTSSESVIDTDAFLRPVSKKELNDFSRNLMNFYSYHVNRLHDKNLREAFGITEEDVKTSDGEYMSLYQLKRNPVVFNKILNYIKVNRLFSEYLKMPEDSAIFNKYRWVLENWNIVIQNGNDQLIKNEGITVEEILNAIKLEKSRREAYNMSAVEMPITADMSNTLKSMLSTIPIRQWEKKTIGGRTIYESVAFVYDEWGMPMFYTQEEVILILVNDLAGSVNESDMRRRMEKLAEKEPYVRDVIESLDENPDIWPLFYTIFNLMSMEYTEAYRSYDNTTRSKHPMSRKLQDRTLYNKLMSKLKIDIKTNKIPLLKAKPTGLLTANKEIVKSLLNNYEKLLAGDPKTIQNKAKGKAEWRASALKAFGITDPKIIAVSSDFERLIVGALKELKDIREDFFVLENVSPLYRLYHNLFLEMQRNANKYSSLSVFSKWENFQRFFTSDFFQRQNK